MYKFMKKEMVNPADYRHSDDVVSRKRRFMEVFNREGVREIDFSNVSTMSTMLGRNFGLAVGAIGASGEDFSLLVDPLTENVRRFRAGKAGSSVRVLVRRPDGTLGTSDHPVGCFGELEGNETLVIETKVVSVGYGTRLYVCIDITRIDGCHSGFAATQVYLGDCGGNSLSGLSDINGIDCTNINELPFAIKEALGYVPSTNYSGRLFEAVVGMLISKKVSAAVELPECGRRCHTVSVIIRRESPDSRSVSLSILGDEKEFRLEELTRVRKHTLTPFGVSRGIRELRDASEACHVQRIHVLHVMPRARMIAGRTGLEPDNDEFERAVVASVNDALRSGAFEMSCGYDRCRGVEFLRGMFELHFRDTNAQVRYFGRSPDAYITARVVGGRLVFDSLIEPDEAGVLSRTYNRLLRDIVEQAA